MTITTTDVEKVASLSRIRLNHDEINHYQQQLNKIVDLAESMNLADTTNLLPMTHPLDSKLTLRPDAVTETDQRDQLLSLAPLVEDSLFLVPTVIEE